MNDYTQHANLIKAQNEIIKPSTAWLLFIFLGWSYGSIGQLGKQTLYYITLGGLGLWTLSRFFTLNKSICKYNDKIYAKYGINGTQNEMV